MPFVQQMWLRLKGNSVVRIQSGCTHLWRISRLQRRAFEIAQRHHYWLSLPTASSKSTAITISEKLPYTKKNGARLACRSHLRGLWQDRKSLPMARYGTSMIERGSIPIHCMVARILCVG